MNGKQYISNKDTCFVVFGNSGLNIDCTFALSTIGIIFLTRGCSIYTTATTTNSLVDNLENYTQIAHVENDVLNLYPKNQGATSNRPSKIGKIGQTYFDTTLKKPIWWNGSNWVDATGATV